jgi:hypothetical protein
LEYLQNRNQPFVPGSSNSVQQDNSEMMDVPVPPSAAQKQELPLVNPMDNPDVVSSKAKGKEPKPGESTFDPMKPKA